MSRQLRRVVTLTAPACPECGTTELTTQRSIDNGDGSRTRVTICDDPSCRTRFDIVVEPVFQMLDHGNPITVTIPPPPNATGFSMPSLNITSIGQTASRLSASVAAVRKAAEDLDVAPAAHINGVAFYEDSDIQRMADHIALQRVGKEIKR